MQKIRINKRENIVQDSGDILFRINITISRKLPEDVNYTSIDYIIEFLNNGYIKDVNNISKEDYMSFVIPNMYKQVDSNKIQIDYLFDKQIIL